MTKSALWQAQLATYPAQLDRQLIAPAWPVLRRLTCAWPSRCRPEAS